MNKIINGDCLNSPPPPKASMRKTWVITDTHFFHNILSKLCGRPENFSELIVKNWVNTVGADDLVIHLGDVGFYKKREVNGLMKGLPGHKILVLGNHDRFPIKTYLENGFMAVVDSLIMRVAHVKGIKKQMFRYYTVMLSHKPMAIPNGVDYGIHGHFHNNKSKRWEEPLVKVLEPRHRLVSLEELGYSPVDLGKAVYHDDFIHSFDKIRH